jgi:hypothetical protein
MSTLTSTTSTTSDSSRNLTRFGALLLVWAAGSLLVLSRAATSTDAQTYLHLLGNTSRLDPARFVADSGFFYWLFGSAYSIVESDLIMIYWCAWTFLFVGMTVLGFRLVAWLLFFSLFPGPDLAVNVVRQGFALGILGVLSRLPLLAYATAAVSHPLSVVSAAYDAVGRWEGVRVRRTTLLFSLALVVLTFSAAWALSEEFRSVLAMKLVGKLGINPFGAGFILRVWLTLAVLAFASGWLLERRERVVALVSLGAVAAGMILSVYLYRVLYAFYPLLILNLANRLNQRTHEVRVIVLALAACFALLNVVVLFD